MPEKAVSIHDYLPHREPMLMVDELTHISHNEAITTFVIKENNILLDGDYLSESGLIENAAQTCSAIVGRTVYTDENGNTNPDRNVVGFISGIKHIRITEKPAVGRILTTTASLVSRYDSDDYSICSMQCQISSDNKIIFEANINLFIKEEK